MGEPQDRLTEIVSVRFTPSEIRRFRTLAADRPLSRIVREMSLGAAEEKPRLVSGVGSWTTAAPLVPVMITVNTSIWSAPTTGDTIRLVAGSRDPDSSVNH